MEPDKSILEKTREYVSGLLEKSIPPYYYFHNLKHTENVAKAALEIGEASGLSTEELEIAQIAAWFHDIGYTVAYKGHEKESIKMAEEFLRKNNYAEEKISEIASCIEATKMPQNPQNLLAQIVCDADLSHLGKKKYFKWSESLRRELSESDIQKKSKQDWLELNIAFLEEHKYFTDYAKQNFNDRKLKNIKETKKLIKDGIEGIEAGKNKQGKKNKKAVKVKQFFDGTPPGRGIETMFRNNLRGHLQLSAIADSKANIMQSVSAIIISIVLPTLVPRLDEESYLTIPTVILLLVCVLTIIFATLSTMPKVSEGTFTKEDIKNKTTNLLFFGNFYKMELTDFTWGMNEMMKDKEFLYSSMIKDFYFLGKVLSRKYKFLRICYSVFMFGIVAVVLAFLIAFTFFGPENVA